MQKRNEMYSEREAQRRFMDALKSAVTTPPKPLKAIPKKKPSGALRKPPGKKR